MIAPVFLVSGWAPTIQIGCIGFQLARAIVLGSALAIGSHLLWVRTGRFPVGIVNIFLGGSGKYVAEELKGTSLYYGIEMPPCIAFDLDTAATHTGTFALNVGSDLLTVDRQFPVYAQKIVAPKWDALDEGKGLYPKPNGAGPSLRPEASVMRQIGFDARNNPTPTFGLWGMREMGLLAFRSFMDAQGPGNSTHLKLAFQERIREALQEAARGGGAVAVNLVASTSGGTGAGTFLPLVLWLREFARHTAQVGEIDISLVLFWWTTFSNEPVEGQVRQELLSKAMSGSYGILRELQLLDLGANLPDLPRFPEREFPLGVKGLDLRYRLNGKLFDRVLWIGRRPSDVTANKTDVYEEGSRLVQLLSIPSVAEMIKANTGTYAQRLVVAVTSVDYPRLRVAQRLSGELVEAAIEQLIGNDDDPVDPVYLYEHGGSQPNAIEAFFRAEADAALSRDKAGNATANPATLDHLIESISRNYPLGNIDRDAQRMDGGCGIEDYGKWQQYCLGLKNDLEHESEKRRVIVQKAARELATESADRLRIWLSRDYLSTKLNPPTADARSASLAAITKGLGRISKDVDAVDAFFSVKMVNSRVPESKDWQYQPTATIQTEIKNQYDELLNPQASGQSGLTPVRWLLVIVGLLGVAVLVWQLTDAVLDGFTHLVASIVPGVLFAVVVGVLLHRSKSLADRRREAEERLFKLYEALAYRQAADALFEAIGTLYVPIARKELNEAQTQIANLRKVYGELLARARSRRTLADKKPLHSVDQVGVDYTLDPPRREPLASKLAQLIRITVKVSSLREPIDMRLDVRGLAPVPSTSGEATFVAVLDNLRVPPPGAVRGATGEVALLADYVAAVSIRLTDQIGELPGQRDFEAIDKTLDDLGTVVLGNLLPKTFEEALIGDGAVAEEGRVTRMRELFQKLMHRDSHGHRLATADRRQPSIHLNAGEEAFKLLLVPDAQVKSLVGQAMEGFGNDAIARELREYQPGAGLLVVPQLGPSIVTLTIFPALDLFALNDSVEAMEAYYGTHRDANHEGFISQRKWNFQIIPEVAAAAAVELSERVVRPLHPLIVSRLIGCNPTTKGPSFLELFYLLRHENLLRIERKGRGSDQTLVAWLELPDHESVTLYSEQAVNTVPSGDPFGDGRSVVNAYDAFTDFMLFSGSSLINSPYMQNRSVTQLPYGAKLHQEEWSAMEPEIVGNLQRAILNRWWDPPANYDGEKYVAALQELARRDSQQMNAKASPDGPHSVSADWYRTVSVLVKIGCDKRDRVAPTVVIARGGDPV
jgi:hypothetical protein